MRHKRQFAFWVTHSVHEHIQSSLSVFTILGTAVRSHCTLLWMWNPPSIFTRPRLSLASVD